MEKVNKSTMNRNMLICNLAEKGEYTYAKIADMCGISEDAVGNIVRKHKELLILEGKVERFNQKEKGFAFNVEDK
jgi:DNA-binding Lrp family transcriptional regulator